MKHIFLIIMILFVFVTPIAAENMLSLENVLEFRLGTPASNILTLFEEFECDKMEQVTGMDGVTQIYCEDNKSMNGNCNIMSFYFKDDGDGTQRLVRFEGIRMYQYDPESMEDDFNKYLEKAGIQNFVFYMDSDLFNILGDLDGYLSVVNDDTLYLVSYNDSTKISYPVMFVNVIPMPEN